MSDGKDVSALDGLEARVAELDAEVRVWLGRFYAADAESVRRHHRIAALEAEVKAAHTAACALDFERSKDIAHLRTYIAELKAENRKLRDYAAMHSIALGQQAVQFPSAPTPRTIGELMGCEPAVEAAAHVDPFPRKAMR